MSNDKKRKGQSKLAFPLGLVIIIFAVIGVIFAVSAGIDGVKNLTDNSEKKLEYETMLIPVVMYDPDMFDDVSSANIDQLTVCAVWGVIKDEDIYPGKYETDDQGNIMIPAEDVEKKFAELFGTDAVPTHIGVKGNFDEFSFNEQSRCYLVTSAGTVPIYTPKVTEIDKTSNTIVLTVGYISGEAWAQDSAGNFIQPEPSKYIKVTLRENDNGYYISALQATDAPENAEPGVTLLTTAPVTIPDFSEEASTDEGTTEETE
ncbi:MAG: hypothetical protein IJ261_01830 [Clostridia bacterium]|nr:hypothetical protein [Clostridia bacterium]